VNKSAKCLLEYSAIQYLALEVPTCYDISVNFQEAAAK
jgi:hypothetical protein